MIRLDLVSVVLITVFVACSKALWLSEISSARGWDMGNGVVLKLNESENTGESGFLDRVSLDVTYGDVGATVSKADTDGVKMNLYVKDKIVEGRGKKGEKQNHIIPLIIGYKTATMMALVVGTIKLLSLKALLIAKIALMISLIIFMVKLKGHEKPEYVEIDHHGGYSRNVPMYAEYEPYTGGYHSAPDGRDIGFLAYNNYATGSGTDSNNYSTLESSSPASSSSSDSGGQQVQQDNENRRSAAGRKHRPQKGVYLTIKKYTEEARGNIR